MEKNKKPRPIVLEIPVDEPPPQMWHKDVEKPEFLKWLDDKPCIYNSLGIDNKYIFMINAPDYIVYEWLEKFYIPLTECELTVDEIIEIFENKGLSDSMEAKINSIINQVDDEEKD
jgi:hypothetical protein